MRLLNAGTFELEEFIADIPRYSILSHTWGKDEVSFQDISANLDASTSKEGFTKIRYCSAQTLADGLRYCWVDTCCIDKTSSAELSEAINSMFRWYREADCCYVYLADVYAEPASEFGDSLHQSRWFTRGWTLQELIASSNRFFFDAEWNLVGRITPEVEALDEVLPSSPVRFRSRLMEIGDHEGFPLSIALDTMIPLDLLCHRTSLEDYCVAEKMRWAADRSTSRLEDMAYCLLGLFDVNMPLLYGEGRKAFIRLQEEIIKTSHDHSIFLWRSSNSSGSTYRGLFARSPVEFKSIDIYRPGTLSGANFQYAYNMTNRGLEMRLPLLPTGSLPGEYIAGLNCTSNDSKTPLFIFLTDLGPQNQFARVDVHGLALDQYDDLKRFEAPEHLRQVFVHQTITLSADYNSSRLEKFIIQPPQKALQLALCEVLPKDTWDAEKRTVSLKKTPYEPLTHGIRTGKVAFDSLAGFVYIIRIQVGFGIEGGSQCKLAKVEAEKYEPGSDNLEWANSVDFTAPSLRRGATFPTLGFSSPEDDKIPAEGRSMELRVELKSRLVDDQLTRSIKLVGVAIDHHRRGLVMELPSPRPGLVGRQTF